MRGRAWRPPILKNSQHTKPHQPPGQYADGRDGHLRQLVSDRLPAALFQGAQCGERQHHHPQRQHVNQRIRRRDPGGQVAAGRRSQE